MSLSEYRNPMISEPNNIAGMKHLRRIRLLVKLATNPAYIMFNYLRGVK